RATAFDSAGRPDYPRSMTPALYAALAVAAVALIAALAALIVVSRRNRPPGELPALISQIDTVRSELRGLSDLFLVPRTRGAVGETILGELLASWLPEGAYDLQYSFSNGTRVDAVIRLGSRLVPVDSKFPLEAIQRYRLAETDSLPADVKKSFRKHIDDISGRYINPSEGTMGFALMYVPAEGVYVELFASRNEELMRYALEKNVVPVSPATLFLYLQTVAYGLRGLAIPEDTRRLLDSLTALRGELAAFARNFELAGGHLRNLTRAFDEAGSRLNRVQLRADRLAEDGGATGTESTSRAEGPARG
ncbi:MAG: DNA recombination protein RmuC, partial [Spirochaetota bacterium]